MAADISKKIISTDTIKQRIGTIFPDCIVLDSQFKVIAISQNILDATGFKREEIMNQSFRNFSRSADLVATLTDKLLQGYFSDERLDIRRIDGSSVDFLVSGFYLGLICDANGFIVLKMSSPHDLARKRDSYDIRTAEIDRFVYVSAHALRGPLATMKGLINLVRTYRHIDDVTFLISQLEKYANTLDDKLHKLIYFAEADKGHEAADGPLRLSDMIASLQACIAQCHVEHQINFKCVADDLEQTFRNGEVVASLFRNLLQFFCQQVVGCKNEIVLDVQPAANCTEFIVHAKGFIPNNLLKARLSSVNYSYSEILDYPELINYYAVKKIAFTLKGEIQFVVSDSNEVSVMIILPITTEPEHS